MLEFGACPRCKLEISPSRKAANPVVCDHCGYVTSNTERLAQIKTENSFIKVAIGISIFVSAAFMQTMAWDKYALEIIPIKAQSLIGSVSPQTHERLAEICMDLKKYACVEESYKATASTEPSKMIRLGMFQMKLAKWNEAAQSFYAFFQNGGQDLEASYNYAKTLAQLGQVDEAVKYFDQVLASKPETLQVTVVQSYVKLLMDHERFEQAKKLMDDIRKSSETAAMFMETEYQTVVKHTTASRD